MEEEGEWVAGSADGRRREATRTRRRTLRLAVPRRTHRCGARRLPGLGLARDNAGSGSQAPRGGTALHCDVGGSASAVRLHLRGLVTSSTGRWRARPWDGPACGRQGRRQAGPRRLLAVAGSAGAGPSVLVLRVQALLSAPQLITICKELRIKGKSEKSASSGSSRTVSSLTT